MSDNSIVILWEKCLHVLEMRTEYGGDTACFKPWVSFHFKV